MITSNLLLPDSPVKTGSTGFLDSLWPDEESESTYRARFPEEDEEERDELAPLISEPATIPALPECAQLDPELARDVSPWLDAYIQFSRRWSPQAYDGFHKAVGLWLLSTVAARRVVLHFGGERYTNLYIALAGRTSIYAKSTTARIAVDVLSALRLSHLLAPDDSTPQAFIKLLAEASKGMLTLSEGLSDVQKEEHLAAARKRMQFAAQKGWFFDEFGQKIAGMMRDNGFMADFRGLLRKFDDCPEAYAYASIARGTDQVDRPYLALMGILTIADLQPYASRHSALWGDGFWARFAFVTPPAQASAKHGRFPVQKRTLPSEITQPLYDWHQRLGIPQVHTDEIVDSEGQGTGRYEVRVEACEPTECTLGPGVLDAFYCYHQALLDL